MEKLTAEQAPGFTNQIHRADHFRIWQGERAGIKLLRLAGIHSS